MQTFDKSLLHLYANRQVTLDDAIAMANNAHDFKIKVRQMGVNPQTAAESGIY
jgi:Tfp pilus assembly ATPase PilU